MSDHSAEKDIHVHECASSGYPAHKPTDHCLCWCGDRFDGRPIASDGGTP